MKIATTLLTGTALALSTGAIAQSQAQPAETMTSSQAQAPMTQDRQASQAPADANFTDAEIKGFAKAAIKLQQTGSNPATNPQEAAQIVTESGIDTQTFNAISQAMQTDPEVAERVQLAAAEIQGQPGG